jgi:hypothetical protein
MLCFFFILSRGNTIDHQVGQSIGYTSWAPVISSTKRKIYGNLRSNVEKMNRQTLFSLHFSNKTTLVANGAVNTRPYYLIIPSIFNGCSPLSWSIFRLVLEITGLLKKYPANDLMDGLLNWLLTWWKNCVSFFHIFTLFFKVKGMYMNVPCQWIIKNWCNSIS